MRLHQIFPWTAGIALAIGVSSGAACAAEPTGNPPPRPSDGCFAITEWRNWKAPARDVLYLGVGMHDVYRVELSDGSPLLQAPDVHLVVKVRGSDWICSPLDLDLSINEVHGIPEPLIARSLTKLTPEEIAAIPAKFRP